jgi:hypothetical protein
MAELENAGPTHLSWQGAYLRFDHHTRYSRRHERDLATLLVDPGVACHSYRLSPRGIRRLRRHAAVAPGIPAIELPLTLHARLNPVYEIEFGLMRVGLIEAAPVAREQL